MVGSPNSCCQEARALSHGLRQFRPPRCVPPQSNRELRLTSPLNADRGRLPAAVRARSARPFRTRARRDHRTQGTAVCVRAEKRAMQLVAWAMRSNSLFLCALLRICSHVVHSFSCSFILFYQCNGLAGPVVPCFPIMHCKHHIRT